MTQGEIRLERKEILNKRLAQQYESIVINGALCFLLQNGIVCRLDSMGGDYNALVIEYADNLDMARKNVFGEDGNLFYMDELGEEEMLKVMLKEMGEVSEQIEECVDADFTPEEMEEFEEKFCRGSLKFRVLSDAEVKILKEQGRI